MDFDATFPGLMDEMYNFYERTGIEEKIRQASEEADDAFWKEELPCSFARVDGEITRVIGLPWTHLKEQNRGFVAMHTITVLAMVVTDPLFAQLSNEKKNVLKWAALLHDIAKLSTPMIEGKDHVHPFKSGAIVLDLFEKLGFIPDLTAKKRTQLV